MTKDQVNAILKQKMEWPGAAQFLTEKDRRYIAEGYIRDSLTTLEQAARVLNHFCYSDREDWELEKFGNGLISEELGCGPNRGYSYREYFYPADDAILRAKDLLVQPGVLFEMICVEEK